MAPKRFEDVGEHEIGSGGRGGGTGAALIQLRRVQLLANGWVLTWNQTPATLPGAETFRGRGPTDETQCSPRLGHE